MAGAAVINHPPRVEIKTLEGWATGNVTDLVICGVKGELYPCKADIFAASYDLTADQAVGPASSHDALKLLSICIVVMKNGFVIIRKSAPASAATFNPELGRKFAYEDAVRQIWPLMGFALRDRLAAA